MLSSVRCTDFRCIASAALSLDGAFNLIVGPNASGKTSLLEAMAYLGRGRSFRGAGVSDLVRHGGAAFIVAGIVSRDGRLVPIGVQNGRDGLEMRVDGERASSAARLAEALPVQVIDPEIHELVGGGPDGRRRFVDWLAFHVEHGYLAAWRDYRRILKQRNAALRAGGAGLAAWDRSFAVAGETIDRARRAALARLDGTLAMLGQSLLGAAVSVEYQQGWAADRSLAAALQAGMARDLEIGVSQHGPHRADLRIRFDDRKARKLVSRGQQKLLACTLILAGSAVVQGALGRKLLLLVDDPAAELDRQSLAGLMAAIESLDSQVVATSLSAETPLFSRPPRLFHVEQGVVTPA